jgi:tRNA_anti-like
MVTKSIWKSLPILLSLLTWTSCQPATPGKSVPMSAGVLSEEYERSSAAVRSKYDGKEIIVRGYAVIAATMPQPGDDQGSVLLEEKEREPPRRVACWFSKDRAEQFSKIKGGQYITVKGIFNGEIGPELEFCKLVKVE